VTHTIHTAVHSLVRINSFGQWKSFRQVWNFLLWWSPNILQYFTEVRHVILF